MTLAPTIRRRPLSSFVGAALAAMGAPLAGQADRGQARSHKSHGAPPPPRCQSRKSREAAEQAARGAPWPDLRRPLALSPLPQERGEGAKRLRGVFHCHGFTLVEVLIALALLSLLMLVLSGALRAMGQTEERVEQRVAAADDYRAAVQLLNDVLGRVSARRFSSLQAGTPQQQPFFQAAPDALAWIGVMPARYGLGGRHYLRLAVEPGPDGDGQLVLRYAPWSGAPTFDAWPQAQAQVLAAPLPSLALRYQEPASGGWSPVWPPPGVPLNTLPSTLLPGAVALQIDGAQPAWPPLVVPLRATRTSDPSAQGGSFGGGAR